MAFWSGHCELCSRVRTIAIMMFQVYSKSVVKFTNFRIYPLPDIGIWLAKEMFVTFVCLLERRYYSLLNTNKLWRTIALIYVNVGQYYKVSQRTSDQEKEKVFWDFQTFRHCTLGESRIYAMIRELGGHERCDWVQTTAIIIVSQCPVWARGS